MSIPGKGVVIYESVIEGCGKWEGGISRKFFFFHLYNY